MIIEWSAPDWHGSAILSYRIEVRSQSGDFYEEYSYCDGSLSAVVSSRQCTIPLLTLQAPPFYLTLGDSVFASVTASNVYGESNASPIGNGAIIVEVPDAPVSLADNVQYTSDTVIALTWNNGISQGGATIIDYKITYD